MTVKTINTEACPQLYLSASYTPPTAKMAVRTEMGSKSGRKIMSNASTTQSDSDANVSMVLS